MASRDEFLKQETLGNIMARYNKAGGITNEWHNRIKTYRDMYNLAHYKDSKAKPNENLYPDPTPMNVTDVAVGILMGNGLEWRAQGWTPSASEVQKTSSVEKYLSGTLEIANEREEYHLPYHVDLNFCRDGAAVIMSVWDPVLAKLNTVPNVAVPDPNSPTGVKYVRMFRETPIRTQIIDPLKMRLIPGGPKRWLHVFRTEKMTVYDVEQVFGVRLAKFAHRDEHEKMSMEGELIDYWRIADIDEQMTDREGNAVFNQTLQQPETEPTLRIINAIIFESEFIREPRVMPGYDDIPYTIGFFKPVDMDDPKNWSHSIITPLETSIRFLERAVNRRMRQIDVFSSLPMVIKAQPSRTIQIDPGFANTARISPTEDITFPIWPGNAPDVQEHIDYLRSRIQQSGFSDVMFGSDMTSASGFALSQLADQNRIRLRQPVKHLEMLWTMWARKVLRMTKNFGANSLVRVYGNMKGGDFADQIIGQDVADYLVRCVIRPEWPNDDVRNTAMATQAAPFLSKRTIGERYLRVEQPDDERKKQLSEIAQEHPVMQQYAIMSVIQELAAEGDEAAIMTLQQMSQQGAPGNPMGRPKEDSNPQQPMGLASSTGLPLFGDQPPGSNPMNEMAREAGRSPGMDGQV